MSGQRPAIPARLAARPVDPRRGLPIPYVSEQNDGSVNFAVINGGFSSVSGIGCAGCADNGRTSASRSSADSVGSAVGCTPIRRATSTLSRQLGRRVRLVTTLGSV
ncbi:hypothetical protein GCM10022225_27100 [Plantactinospora mayteni]|uniref:Uncharacterized protein n=1 Tax=Plantactinospora mayteni TaxID=566021 RepID=A0ABQ4EIL5_9ACTN|nr:hypothetical protein Pma05_11330 [Plantactinospora mayteni]